MRSWIARFLTTTVLVAQAPRLVQSQDCAAALPALPEPVAAAKAEIIRLCQNNLDQWGNPEFQLLVDAQAAILEEWYVNNRPDNEVELTTGPWLAIWYEDNFFARGNFFFNTDRTNTYQVVRDGFYYNVARNLIFGGLFVKRNFLRGAYSIIDPKTSETCGQPRRNVIDLEFTRNIFGSGWLSPSESLVTIVDEVESGERSVGIDTPGPIGVTGELWNLYVDDDLRVCFGIGDDDDDGEGGGMFVLIRQEFVTSG